MPFLFNNKQYHIFNIKMERVKTTKVKSTSIVSFPPQINPVLKCQPIKKQGAPGIFPKSPLSFFFQKIRLPMYIKYSVHYLRGTTRSKKKKAEYDTILFQYQ